MGGLISVFLIHKFKRRILLRAGSLILCASLLGLSIGFWNEHQESTSKIIVYLILISYFAFLFTFVITMGPLMWILLPEIVQPSFVSVCILIHWFMSFVITALFPMVRGQCINRNCPELFLVFGVSMVGLFILSICIVETKDKSELEIRE